MSAVTAAEIPLAVRIRNGRYDGMITGWLTEAPKFTESDPGGMVSASFTVSERLGFRSDLLQPYSRVYFLDKRTGDVVFEGDVTFPGRSYGGEGSTLEVQVEGGAAQLNDWFGPRVYVDRDMTAWLKTGTASVSATVEPGEDRSGSGLDALNLGFPMEQHVETNSRAEAIYTRIAEAGQSLARIDYTWDAGLSNVNWIVRTIISTPGSTVVRTQTMNTGGGIAAPVTVGTGLGPFPSGAIYAYVQQIWIGGPSATASTDTSWVALRGLVVVAEMVMKNGAARASATYQNYVTAPMVLEDMLGSVMAGKFDAVGAQIDVGGANFIWQFAFPDGVSFGGLCDELMVYEPGCTYLVGASDPLTDKYSFTWLSRPTKVRYEVATWADDIQGGVQPADQINEVTSRWKTATGNIRFTKATRQIPEMDAVGRTRSTFQDLGPQTGDATNAINANNTVLDEHRYPANGGQATVARPIVDLFTGRRVQPWEIKPGYLCRVVGVTPTPDVLNATARNGSTVCRIVNKSYDGASGTATLDLDSQPWGVLRSIRAIQAVGNGKGRGALRPSSLGAFAWSRNSLLD